MIRKRKPASGTCENLGIIIISVCVFLFFLALPMIFILKNSFTAGNGFTLDFYQDILAGKGFGRIFLNSVAVSGGSALITTILAFCAAYTINYTNVPRGLKTFFRYVTSMPMFLPTITYGFAIIYAFGKKGLFTRLFGGHQLFAIYGWHGLVIGYVIYTLPVSFMLLNNAMGYVDKKFCVISRVLGDRPAQTFWITAVRPLLGTMAVSIIQCFFLSFTDYGIPMAVGGRFRVLATTLYTQMLGSFPDFNRGAVIALVMLLPSAASILLLTYMQRFNIRYRSVSRLELRTSHLGDTLWGLASGLISFLIIGVFATIIIVPSVRSWPYRLTPAWEHFQEVLTDSELTGVYWNSVFMALMTALFGTILVFCAGLAAARSQLRQPLKKCIDVIALVSNTIPGMVIGIGYLLAFSGTSLQGTFLLLVACTVVHYFSTPFLMMEEALSLMDPTWETVGRLMGDSWIKTVLRVIMPNSARTLAEVFSYYFLNAMVTVSAVIFIVGADTMLLTTKIQELEHYQQFDDIFVLSILILLTNLAVKCIVQIFIKSLDKRSEKGNGNAQKIVEADRPADNGGNGSISAGGLRGQFQQLR